MGYNDLSECTLTQDERAVERDRILTRLTAIQDELTPTERNFVMKIDSANYISTKQLFWLRDINGKY